MENNSKVFTARYHIDGRDIKCQYVAYQKGSSKPHLKRLYTSDKRECTDDSIDIDSAIELNDSIVII